MINRRVMAKALDQHRLYRDVCERGAKCVTTASSRRATMTMGGHPVPCVFCDICGVGREDHPERTPMR